MNEWMHDERQAMRRLGLAMSIVLGAMNLS